MISFSQFLNEQTITEDPELIAKDRESNYGQELILDIHEVPKNVFDKKFVREFVEKLCDEIEMKRGPNYLWGDAGENLKDPKADGISCVQFLYSSSITIHAIDKLQKVFINIFSCRNFDADKARQFVTDNLGGTIVAEHNITRK